MLRRALKFTRADDDKSVLSGYAFKYDEIADIHSWFIKYEERMSPDLIVNVDPECLLLRGHDPDKILGKVNKNLFFENKKEGLYFRVTTLPETQLARETKELVDKGFLSGLSIGFFEEESHKEKDILVIDQIRLVELSIVSWPAYDSGRIDKRATINYLKKKPYKKVDEESEVKPPELIT